MHVLLLNQFCVPDMAPTGRVLFDLARTLIDRGHQVTILCSSRSYDGNTTYHRGESRDGVTITRLPAFGLGRRSHAGKILDYASFYVLLAWRLLWIRPKPDVMVALTTPPYIGLLAKAIGSIRGIRHAHWIMDLYPDVMQAHGMLREASFLYRALAGLTRFQFRGSALVLTLGPDMARHVGKYAMASTPVKWVPLWGDDALATRPQAAANRLREARGWSLDQLVLMYSGNMGLGHRFSEFLALAKSLRHDTSLRWVFAGSGKRRIEIESAIEAESTLPVELLPYASSETLSEHLSSADVLLASLEPAWQGFMVPSKVQACFAVGLPVIFVGSDCNSLAQWIHASNGGWVVAPDDLKGLHAAVKAARDPAERRRRGQSARKFAEIHFDRRKNTTEIAEQLENHFT